jgi:hypothetical protein
LQFDSLKFVSPLKMKLQRAVDLLTLDPDTAPRPARVARSHTPTLIEICSGVTEGSIKEQDDHRTQFVQTHDRPISDILKGFICGVESQM